MLRDICLAYYFAYLFPTSMMNNIANARNNISVEVEYLYSLQVKTRSFYNFTQS
jgi:hypothetical protein